MLFWIPIPDLDLDVCVQFVKRGKTVYIRSCPDTMFRPTEAQREVRDRLTEAAHKSSGLPLLNFLERIKEAFRDWESVSTANKNTLMELLSVYYPDDVESVIEYLKNS